MLVFFLISSMLGWCFDGVLIRVLLANLVPSKIQSFTEALRSGVCRLAMVAGSLTVGVILPWLQWWSVGIILIHVFIIIAYIRRGTHFKNPREIVFIEWTKTFQEIKDMDTT